MTIPSRHEPQISFRMQRGLKEQIELMAKNNNRSRNAEIVFLLDQAVAKAQKEKAPSA
jgi:hypothetical protein